jgi:hypothetical protein
MRAVRPEIVPAFEELHMGNLAEQDTLSGFTARMLLALLTARADGNGGEVNSLIDVIATAHGITNYPPVA